MVRSAPGRSGAGFSWRGWPRWRRPTKRSSSGRPTAARPSALSGDPLLDEEDLHATAVASYNVLLAAHGRGLAGYWRTPDLLRDPEGRAAVGLPDEERFVALLHLGHPRQERPAPPRPPVTETTVFLD